MTQFDKHQHYKNRKPPWIKFHVKLLDPNHPINRLPIPTRLLFDRLLLLAAEWDNAIPKIPELIASHTGIPLEDCREGIEELLKGRWLSETETNRRASKSARGKTRNALAPELELEKEKESTTKAVTSTEDVAGATPPNGTAPNLVVREIIKTSLGAAT